MTKSERVILAGFGLVALAVGLGVVLIERRIAAESEKINRSITDLPSGLKRLIGI
jgi:hypothetical protein